VIPYIEVGPWQLGPPRVYPFGAMVACALATWLVMILRRAAPSGLDSRVALRLFETVLVAGFLGAVVTGHSSYSSFGGAFGALAGATIYMCVRPMPEIERWRYLDLLAYAFPFGWAFLRLGCTLVHEHPGRLTSSWLGVRYPGGTRYDLGMLEMLLSIAVACIFAVVGNRKQTPGFYICWLVICGPVRLVLDLLRDDPQPFFGIVLTVIGVAFWVRVYRFVT
jgi:phosphatidylglycerol:prolipoprotein diacylglycerol transferase